MDIFLYVVLIIVGFVLIIKGGDWFVDASTWIARLFGVPEIIIGATIVSIGTTLPELLTSLISVINGMQSTDPEVISGFNEIAIGNAVGSMMCNMGLILALVMLIRPPKTEGKSFVTKAVSVLFISALLCVFAMTNSSLELWEGIVLLVLFVAFITMNVVEALKGRSSAKLRSGMLSDADTEKEKQKEEARKKNKWLMSGMFIAGAVGIALGAMLLVENVQNMCLKLGVSQQILGVTVVALGTSLPELVTSLTSLRKGTANIGVGNIIGANIINASLLLGLITVVTGSGLVLDWITKNVAIWIMLGITAVLIVPSIFLKRTTRWQGAIMMALYVGFVIYNVVYVVAAG